MIPILLLALLPVLWSDPQTAGTNPEKPATIRGRVTDNEYSSARISRSGTFRLGPQRGGDYVVVALPTELSHIRSNDYERLTQLAATGERVTLRDEQERVLDLRIVKPR
jgi:hypothetical protein